MGNNNFDYANAVKLAEEKNEIKDTLTHCPLLIVAVMIGNKVTTSPVCRKEKCAWWVDDVIMTEHSSCALKKIATELMIVATEI